MNAARRLNALILGANSRLGQAFTAELAQVGFGFVLVSRDECRLRQYAAELTCRGIRVESAHAVDLTDIHSTRRLFHSLRERNLSFDVVLIAQGVYYTDAQTREDASRFLEMISVNYFSAAHCAQCSASLLMGSTRRELIVASSVSGDRSRAHNSGYASTKAALNAFLEGLRLQLAGSNVNVMIVKPGPLLPPDSEQHTYRRFGSIAPRDVARVACRAMGTRARHVYAPRYLRYLMILARLIPERFLQKKNKRDRAAEARSLLG